MSIQSNKPQFMIKAHFYIEYIRKTDSIISQKIPFSPLNQNLTNELLSKAQLPYTKN